MLQSLLRSLVFSRLLRRIKSGSIPPFEPMLKHVEVLADQPALIARALAVMVDKIGTAIQERGICTIALSGGSTPKPLYEAMAGQNLPWENIHIFWGDERYVPADHPDSNQKMAREAWLDRVNFDPSHLHPMPTHYPDPAEAAQAYQQHLQEFFGVQPGEFPAFDINLLGMGDDGHTASLFPHTEALQVCDRLITVGYKDGQPRITFTIPLINQSRCILFVVEGEKKRAALNQVFSAEANPLEYPSRLIEPSEEIWYLFDRAVAADLQL